MGKYRTFEQVEEEYYREHPEEIDSFLNIPLRNMPRTMIQVLYCPPCQ